MKKTKIKCIIFDCDGVLVDSELIGAKVLMELAKPLGFRISTEAFIAKFSGKSLKSIFEFIEEHIKEPLPDSFEKEYRFKSSKAFKSELKPIVGVQDALEGIKVPYCVASSGPRDKIISNLTTTGLIDKFEGRIFSSYDINSWKPDPGIFLYAASQISFEPKDCLVVEDSISGIQAARAGGFNVVGFKRSGNRKLWEALDVPLFDNMCQLTQFI